jgi:hypothetical protein
LSLLLLELFVAKRARLPVQNRKLGLKRAAAEIKRAAANGARVTDVVTRHTAADNNPTFRGWRPESQHNDLWFHLMIPLFGRGKARRPPTEQLSARQFTRMIDQQGFDGLMSAMRKKQDELRQSGGGKADFSFFACGSRPVKARHQCGFSPAPNWFYRDAITLSELDGMPLKQIA